MDATNQARFRVKAQAVWLSLLVTIAGCDEPARTSSADPSTPNTTDQAASMTDAHLEHPYLFHLIQAELWQAALANDSVYYPPTYDQDGFTHATANPELLLNVANHFYTDVPGKWLCLQMTTDSLKAAGVDVVFEGTAPVGDKQPEFSGSDDELFPHILGGIPPTAVLGVLTVDRDDAGRFLVVHFDDA